MRKVTIAVTQFACSWDLPDNLDRAEALVRRAAGDGAEVILLQELFAAPYFCITEDPRHFALAAPFEGHPVIARFAALARELGVVLPVSIFERAGEAHFNTMAMVDADGCVLGRYRKSHIPIGSPPAPNPAGTAKQGNPIGPRSPSSGGRCPVPS